MSFVDEETNPSQLFNCTSADVLEYNSAPSLYTYSSYDSPHHGSDYIDESSSPPSTPHHHVPIHSTPISTPLSKQPGFCDSFESVFSTSDFFIPQFPDDVANSNCSQYIVLDSANVDTLNFSASSGESLIVIEPETVSHDADETTESNYTDLLPCYTSKSSSTLVTHQKCCAYSCLSYFTASEVGNALRFFKCKNIVEQNQFLLDSFKVISNEESINHLICGKQVCRKAYIQILEISEKRYKNSYSFQS